MLISVLVGALLHMGLLLRRSALASGCAAVFQSIVPVFSPPTPILALRESLTHHHLPPLFFLLGRICCWMIKAMAPGGGGGKHIAP